MNQFINEDAIKASTAAMEKGYEQFVEMTKSQVEKMFPAAAKNFDELAAFNKASYEAAAKASQAAAKVFETLGKTVATYNQENFQASVNKDLADVLGNFVGKKKILISINDHHPLVQIIN